MGKYFILSLCRKTYMIHYIYMRTLHRTPKVSRERAIQIAANHNRVSKEVAATYNDSELKEVLRQLKLKANF